MNLKVLAKTLVQSLYSLMSQEAATVSEIEQDDSLKALMYWSFRTCATYADIGDMYDIFAESKVQLFYNVILPCLITTDSELINLEESPEEFVSYALDTADAHKSVTLKCGAMKLLEILCDSIDGCLTLVSYVSNDLLNFA